MKEVVASSQFLGADSGSIWVDGDVSYLIGHPDILAALSTERVHRGFPPLTVFNLDLSANAELRSQVFDSWRRWNAGQRLQ